MHCRIMLIAIHQEMMLEGTSCCHCKFFSAHHFGWYSFSCFLRPIVFHCWVVLDLTDHIEFELGIPNQRPEIVLLVIASSFKVELYLVFNLLGMGMSIWNRCLKIFIMIFTSYWSMCSLKAI